MIETALPLAPERARGAAEPLRSVLRRLVLLCMLPLVALSGYLSVQNVRSTRAQMDEAADEMATGVAAAIDQSLMARIGALGIMAGSFEGGDADKRKKAYDEAVVFRRTFGSDVVLTDRQGQMLFNSRVPWGTQLPPLPRPAAHAAVPQALATGRPAVGDLFSGPIAHEPLVAVAVPVAPAPAGATEYVLLTTLTQHQLLEQLVRPTLPAGWKLSLLDGKHDMIASASARGGASSASTAGASAAGSPGTPARQFIAASNVAPWSVVIDIEAEEYRAPVWIAVQRLALILVAAISASLLGSGWAGRKLARSVTSLVDASPGESGRKEVAEVVAVRQRLQDATRAREAAVDAMQESQSTFKSMFDGMSDAIVFTDVDRHVRMINPAFTAMFGYRSADVLGRTTEFLYADPADFEWLGREMRHAASASRRGTYEMQYRRQDGSVVTAESSAVRVIGPNGDVIGLMSVHRDIADRQQAASLNVELAERFATVFHVCPLAVAIGRLGDGLLVDVNAALEALLGYGREEMLGKTPGELQIWVDRQAQADVVRAMEAGGSVSTIETQFRRKSGQIIDVSYVGTKIQIAGEPHFLGMASDITVQKQARRDRDRQHELLETLVAQRTADLAAANAELQTSVRFNRTITDNLPGRVSYWDAQLKCRFVNRPYLDWAGVPADALLGRTMEQVLDPDYYRSIVGYARAALQGEAATFERDVTVASGLEAVRLHYIPDRVEDGTVRGIYVLSLDITAYKRAQAELSVANEALKDALDKAQGATRAKSAFLANMSHEIRTPMNAIIGLTHLMTRDTQDTVQRDRLAKVDNAARHLLQVINDILDLSKIEAGKMTLEDSEFSVDEMLSRTFDLVAAPARDKGIELVLDIDRLPSHLRGDSQRLAQTVLNLLANAVKFTEHGWIRLRAERRDEDGQRVLARFEIQDTGPGIAADHQAALFGAFEQADASITRRHGGTGLGLALTRHFAAMMGGTVGVSSQPGHGSTFWFTAWLGRARDVPDPVASAALSGLRALLVDDLAPAREAIRHRLQRLGLSEDVVASGHAAVQRVGAQTAAGRPYHVWLIDWRMQPMDGIDALTRLRRLVDTAAPPSILLTAFNETHLWEQSRQAGFDAVLVKPVTPSVLRDTLLNVLRKTSPAASTDAHGLADEAITRLRRHAGQRVLLVEDNPINQEVAAELLTTGGLSVETAVDGAQAVELATTRSYALILMDVQMPVMDGLAATRVIRARCGDAVPIVAMTANAFSEDRAACLDAGMNDHVSKPVDPQVLYSTLLRWLAAAGLDAPSAACAPEPPSAPLAVEPLQVRLSRVGGFDVEAALRNVGGEMSILTRVLGRFVQTYRHGEAALLVAATPDPVPGWAAAAHSLRGACATLGASLLPPQLEAFERDLHRGRDVATLARTAQLVNEQLLALVGRLAAELER